MKTKSAFFRIAAPLCVLCCLHYAYRNEELNLNSSELNNSSHFHGCKSVRINSPAEVNLNEPVGVVIQQVSEQTNIENAPVKDSAIVLPKPQALPYSSYKGALEDYLKRPYLISHASWLTTTTTNSYIYGAFSVPVTTGTWTGTNCWYVSGNPAYSMLAGNFTAIKGTMMLRISVTGNPYYYGKLNICVWPHTGQLDSTGVAKNTVSSSCEYDPGVVRSFYLPHVEIDPSVTASYEVEVPMLHPTGMWSLGNTGFGSGSPSKGFNIGVIPVNTLNSILTGDTPACQLCFFLYFKEYELFGPCHQSAKEEEQPTGTISSSLAKVSSGAGMMSTVPGIGGLAQTVSNISSISSKVAQALGFSKPLALEERYITQGLVSPNYNTVSGRMPNTLLSRQPNNEISISPTISGCTNPDDWLIASLCKKWGFFSTLSMTTSNNGLLYTFPVNPMICYFDHVTGTSPSVGTFEPTALAWLGYIHQFWSGSLELCVEVIASKFHRGTVAIMFNPQGNSTSFTTTSIGKLETMIIQISGTTKHYMKIPYSSPVPALNASTFFNKPSGTSGSTGCYQWYNQTTTPGATGVTCNGWIGLYVMNPLTPSDTGTPGIQFNFYLKAGDDFRYSIPYLDATSNPLHPLYQANQSSPDLLVGEEVTSTIQLAKIAMFNKVTDTGATAGNPEALYFGANSILIPQYSGYDNNWNFLSWCSQLYWGYRGGLRYSINNTRVNLNKSNADGTDASTGTIVRLITANSYNAGFTVAPGLQFASLTTIGSCLGVFETFYSDRFATSYARNSPFFNCQVPWLYPAYFLPLQQQYYDTNFVSFYVDGPFSGSNLNMMIAQYAADDFTWIGFRGVPRQTSTSAFFYSVTY